VKIKVSVIIPVFNEESTIVEILSKVRAQSHEHVEYEVIVIDDGSTDNSSRIIKEHANLYDTVFFRTSNGGKGAAVLDGLSRSTGTFILFQDADLEYDPIEYANLVEPILNHSAQVVVGTRLSGGQLTRVHYFWHQIGNKLITLLFNILHNTTFTDIYSCYLIFDKSLLCVDDIQSSGWNQQAEILSLLVKRHPIIYETPIKYFGRSYDEGKKIRAVHTFAVLISIVKTRIRRIY
jgi:glycosyltransferase involved in cell wall biosynthesis